MNKKKLFFSVLFFKTHTDANLFETKMRQIDDFSLGSFFCKENFLLSRKLQVNSSRFDQEVASQPKKICKKKNTLRKYSIIRKPLPLTIFKIVSKRKKKVIIVSQCLSTNFFCHHFGHFFSIHTMFGVF